MSRRTSSATAACLVLALPALAVAGGWSGRSYDNQNTGNVGEVAELVRWPQDAKHLKELFLIPTEGMVNATPAVTADDLLIVGDWAGFIYVIDLASGARLVQYDTGVGADIQPGEESSLGNYVGVQSTAVVATVTLPDGTEQERFYVGANTKTKGFYCFDLDAIRARRAELTEAPSTDESLFCEGVGEDGERIWPMSLDAGGNSRDPYNASPMFSRDQPVDLDGDGQVEAGEVADVIYTPTTGLDCANGEMWAVDAYSGRKYWGWDPVLNGNGTGGVIWTTPAMNRDRSLVYITTGNCVGKPQAGENAEALVALDAGTGEVAWFHQRRLVDTADLDIGNGPTVVDVDGFAGCHVVVSPDKDGCIYAFEQQPDVPEVGEIGFDPLRPGQQRLLWRQCYVPGSLNGGFNAMNATAFGRVVAAQVSGTTTGRFGADNANAFAVDACTGQTVWASTSIGNSRGDGAAAGPWLFFPSVWRSTFSTGRPYVGAREVVVVGAHAGDNYSPEILATIEVSSQPTLGGGGISIANGRVFVPTVTGISVIGRVEQSYASEPIDLDRNGGLVFAGPYPHPVAGVALEAPLDPDHPERLYPLMLEKNITALMEYRNTPEGGPPNPAGVLAE